ncbi:fatty acid desaturase [Paenibacillus sp. PsM32]|uniref:Fatty acid desaturase n=1 Tax=Paenibacillus kyungheensis TaxID=1452732 RepID=A0AAX3M493_9BACL|nr:MULTISPECIES: fatty acid desaturase [Paenibacillus]MDN4617501.1 fatty acid desaturase [Paenibacillus sp. PsM32]MDQ1232655.1 omega-6 fatty acid desaturase (delta-12 desaturase) [Paenibacillus sp. SORGH_AS_0306]MDR6109706.1 omega-6 fatty acid desaturase (delta-12 desaturase) [Paenibacillus sp. SORGH_AS_0338]WCT56686.1 fatty acid desaturase [Paenibacillus kyungheensis]WDF50211.1 fatty acid desaturase [Paenibacillus sp. KACC 21273]
MSTTRVTKDQDNWRKSLAPYEKSNTKYSVWQLINTLVPFFGLWYLAYLSLSVSYWLTIPIMVLAGGFLVRTFIIFHDCCHRSFFKNRKANTIVGNITGIMTLCSYDQWRYSHSMHHATNGNLDKRGTGDIWTLTVNEYLALSPLRRWVYRMYRNPMIMFTIGPIYTFLLIYRFNRKGAPKKERMNTYMVNVALVAIIGLLCWAIGWQAFLMIQGPIFFMSGVGGIWLFYVQHQFEESYFEEEENWNYVKAAMHGSSFYKLPKILHWITGNIGFHHIHHLSSRVPNYFLESAHNTSPVLQDVQTITLLTSLQSLRFRIWNEDTKKFIGFKDIDTSLKVKNKKQQQKAG